MFQHGQLTEHYLAVIAIAKGNTGATWIAAATLDRYLQSIARPQIYGTQFETKDGEQSTQGPYNPDIISDALRHQLGVPSSQTKSSGRTTTRPRPSPNIHWQGLINALIVHVKSWYARCRIIQTVGQAASV